jgi:uncharacterized protein (DUF1800 family)
MTIPRLRNFRSARRLLFVVSVMAAGAARPAVPRAQGKTVPVASNFSPDLVRLVEQSTFGPTLDLVQHVHEVGAEAFLGEQLAAAATPYPDLPPMPSTRPATCTGTCSRDNYSMYPVQRHFFSNALTGEDQLRQRLAFALGQIFVVSGVDVRLSSWMSPYQQLLYADSFTTYRQLLQDVTLSAAMGNYLNMVNNKKLNPATGVKPNENYAREVLQLFSIGLVMLNDDGTPQLDENGQTIPTYDQATVEEFARVFTGWVFAPQFGAGVPNYRDPMVVKVVRKIETDHDSDAKQLLLGAQVPAGLTAAADLAAALDNIASHPNVAPFIGKQLIQHLVTSNPSPAYVARISAVFNDNGSGVRGDLGAVVTAILLDPEARGNVHTEADYGHLLEPALFIVRVLRALNATSDGVLDTYATNMGQDVFRPSSVFSFYPPGYRIVGGGGLLGPEFRLENSASTFARANFVNTVVFNGIAASDPDRPLGTKVDLTRLLPLAPYSGLLVDELCGLMTHQSASVEMRDAIRVAIDAIPASSAAMRVKTAAYLIASSSQYQVER